MPIKTNTLFYKNVFHKERPPLHLKPSNITSAPYKAVARIARQLSL